VSLRRKTTGDRHLVHIVGSDIANLSGRLVF